MLFTPAWWRKPLVPVLAGLVGLAASGALAEAQNQRPRTDTPRPADPGMKSGDILKSPADPAVAVVEGRMIYLSDVRRAIARLPEAMRALPFDTLFPVVLERLIDRQALLAVAQRQHLDDEPVVRRDVNAAAERIIEAALLSRDAESSVTEDKIQARYNREYAGKPASEEVRVRHILVPTESDARKLIAELAKGADFPTLAKENSKDPDGATGGDLGFFRRDQVSPDFADAAFALQPGEVARAPVRNEFGWHVIKLEARRIVAPPSYSEAHDRIRQELLQEAIQRSINQARFQVTIRRFNLDGTPLAAAQDAMPAPPLVRPDDSLPKE